MFQFDPELNQLVFTPLPELVALRQSPPLLNLTQPTPLQPGKPLGIVSGVNHTEVEVVFEMPTADV